MRKPIAIILSVFSILSFLSGIYSVLSTTPVTYEVQNPYVNFTQIVPVTVNIHPDTWLGVGIWLFMMSVILAALSVGVYYCEVSGVPKETQNIV